MRPAPFALFVLALVVAMAWPLSSAVGGASADLALISERGAQACTPDVQASAPSDVGAGAHGLALPPGHPPIARELPPGHPPISEEGLPPGHPPVGRGLPPGHPPVPSGHGFGTLPPADLFGAPVLLTI